MIRPGVEASLVECVLTGNMGNTGMVIPYRLHANVACLSSDTGTSPGFEISRATFRHVYDVKVVSNSCASRRALLSEVLRGNTP